MENQSGQNRKSASAMKPGWPYALLNVLAALTILGGSFSLIGHLAGQIREGYATMQSLFGGVGGVTLGIILLALADLGARLVRIETKMGTLPSNDFADEEQHQPASAEPTRRGPSE